MIWLMMLLGILFFLSATAMVWLCERISRIER